jgi:hypothetical protein
MAYINHFLHFKLARQFVLEEDDMGRACNTIGKKRNAYRILTGKSEGKRPLGRHRRRWWIVLKWILER